MDLSSASTYLNNLLAKAGLLRGGTTVNFNNPSSEDGSTTRIINLVHDLITRREKEEEQLESLANTIRTLRSDNAKLQQANEKLSTKCEDLERKNAVLEGQQKAFNATLRTSESATKSLRDETARLKMVLQQVRNQFANDLRKRDVQLSRIKEQLLHPRRNPKNVNTITITGTTPPAAADAGPQNACGPDCIAQDTADALTELSQTLANENDNLVSITRQTLSTLNSMQGIKDDFQWPAQEDSGDAFLSVCPQTFDALSEELQRSLASLRDLLNQPNYVAIEELQERDKIIEEKEKEITRLQARIEVVEEEWRKAIEMVKMWNESMRGKLPSAAVAPKEIPQERAVGGLEQILEEEEEEEEVYSKVEQYAEAEEEVGDVSLDEEQLQREASMLVDGVEDAGEGEEEEEDLEAMENMLDMEEEYNVDNAEENQMDEDVEEEEEEEDEHQLEDEVPGDEEPQIEMEDDHPDEEREESEGDAELPNQDDRDETPEAATNMAVLDSTPPPTSPPKLAPHRPRRTPRSLKTRMLDENVSPSPMKLRNTPSKRTPSRRSPRKALAPAPAPGSPSPMHTKINRFLSDILQAESPAAAQKESPRKKNTKRAHFESPLVQDTPELSTPKRTRKDSAPIPQPQFVKLQEQEDTPSTPKRASRSSNNRGALDTPSQAPLTTPRRSARAINKNLFLDLLPPAEEGAPSTPRRTPRLRGAGLLLDTPQQAEEGTPRRTRVSKKRVLLDTPDQPTSTRVSKRRKTPAVKKRAGVSVGEEEKFSH